MTINSNAIDSFAENERDRAKTSSVYEQESLLTTEEIDKRINGMTEEERENFRFSISAYMSDGVANPDDVAIYNRMVFLSQREFYEERKNHATSVGDDYYFEFCVTKIENIHSENPKDTIVSGLSQKEAMSLFKEEVRTGKDEHVYLGFYYATKNEPTEFTDKEMGKCTLMKFENGSLSVSKEDIPSEVRLDMNYGINFHFRDLHDYKFDFDRANKPFESISSMLSRSRGSDYDSCDADFDVEVTICEIDRVNDNYDRFCKDVHDRVNVIREESALENLCCDWSEFVYRYYDKLKDFSNENWVKHNYNDPDDFVCEWIEETQRLMAGYGTESDYGALCKVIESEPNRQNEQYKHFLENTIYPYLPQGKTFCPVNKETQQVLDDYNKGHSFPDKDEFKGVKEYNIMFEINNTVVGVRGTDCTYATWRGSSATDIVSGHYDMNREEALEDFALRAGLIKADRYLTAEQVKEYHSLLSEKHEDFKEYHSFLAESDEEQKAPEKQAETEKNYDKHEVAAHIAGLMINENSDAILARFANVTFSDVAELSKQELEQKLTDNLENLLSSGNGCYHLQSYFDNRIKEIEARIGNTVYDHPLYDEIYPVLHELDEYYYERQEEFGADYEKEEIKHSAEYMQTEHDENYAVYMSEREENYDPYVGMTEEEILHAKADEAHLELASRIEQFMFDRGEYDERTENQIFWLHGTENYPDIESRRQAVTEKIIQSFENENYTDDLVKYFDSEIFFNLDEDDELLPVAKELVSELSDEEKIMLELSEGRYKFTEIVFDNGDTVITPYYVDDLYDDNEDLQEYLEENKYNFDGYIDAEISHYVIGKDGEDTEYLSRKQIDYIRKNEDKVFNTCDVDLVDREQVSARTQDLFCEDSRGY